jgi:hypothetical protein|tara:strand:+ start:4849 stop:5322 length:474 start_codon:yes stop_codon:yes gene_type:complete
MIVKPFLISAALLFLSSCSLLGTKQIEIISKPAEIKIIQPILPRPIDLSNPKWYVVSEAVIANPCKKVEDKRPKICSLQERENPDWTIGYTYLDRFIADMKKLNNGDVVFTAMTIGDYELMASNTQELRRYIRELGEVIVYYRSVTIKEDKPTTTVD